MIIHTVLWLKSLAAPAKQPASEVFRMWDVDSDGYLSYEEFVECYLSFQARLSSPSSGIAHEDVTPRCAAGHV